MADENKNSNPDYGAITKWLVIGVVLIVLIVVLKKPLTGLVDNADNVVISSKGVEIHRAKTAVGEITVSSETIKADEVSRKKAENPNFNLFESPSHYVIGWPRDTWQKDDQKLEYLRQNLQMPGYTYELYCARKVPSASGFTPNINVVTGPPEGTVSQIVEAMKSKLLSANAKILDQQTDESSNGAVLVYSIFDNVFTNMQLYYIQRIATANGMEYVITATTTANDDQATKDELMSILNSFKLVSN